MLTLGAKVIYPEPLCVSVCVSLCNQKRIPFFKAAILLPFFPLLILHIYPPAAAAAYSYVSAAAMRLVISSSTIGEGCVTNCHAHQAEKLISEI